MADTSSLCKAASTGDDAPVVIQGQSVLFADDEELMREVVSIMIEENGGKVFLAVDGVDAVELFREHKEEISYTVLDFSMPNMDGYEAYLEIKKINPEAKVMFVSGLNITPEVEELVRKREVIFLSKPFNEKELLGAFKSL